MRLGGQHGSDMTRLIMTLLVRDNADIVAANMDFHLAMGVDHIIVTNNRSEDATRNIVLDYVRRGAATLIDEYNDDYDQSTWVTRMARMAARDLSADWVINSDVDEFWWPWMVTSRRYFLRYRSISASCQRLG